MELTTALTPPIGAMLDQLDPVLAPPLFAPGAVERLRRLSLDLPPAHFLLFETHLGAVERVDLSVPDPARPNAMLEFDLDSGGAPPALFVTLPAGRGIGESALLSLAGELRDDLPFGSRTALARAAAAQRDGASWITHLGIMRGRPGKPLRINAGASSPDALRAFAEAVGCDAPQRSLLDTLLRLVEDLPLTLILALDLDSGPLPRLGVECYAYPPQNAAPALLERLVREGLCSAAEADAILAWPDEGGEGLALPEPYYSLDAFLGPDGLGRLVRSLNHVKLVGEAGGAVSAKVYLGACYSPGPRPAAAGLAA